MSHSIKTALPNFAALSFYLLNIGLKYYPFNLSISQQPFRKLLMIHHDRRSYTDAERMPARKLKVLRVLASLRITHRTRTVIRRRTFHLISQSRSPFSANVRNRQFEKPYWSPLLLNVGRFCKTNGKHPAPDDSLSLVEIKPASHSRPLHGGNDGWVRLAIAVYLG